MRTALPLEGTPKPARNVTSTRLAQAAVGTALVGCLFAATAAPANAAPLAAGTLATATATTTTDLAVDSFGRTLTGSWGTADKGGTWSTINTAATFSVAANGASHTVPAGHTAYSHLEGATTTDADVRVDLALDQATTGSGVYASVIARKVGTTGDYRARVKVMPTGAVVLQVARDTTAIAATTVSGLTYAPGTKLSVRVQATGTAPTTVRAKVWKAGTTEPSAWQVTTTDSTAALQTAGGVGLTTYVGSTATRPVKATWSALRVVTTAAPVAAAVVQPAANVAPTALAAARVTGLTAALTGTGSKDTDGTIVSYAWSNGDGTTTTGATAGHTYAKAGTYPVTLTVTDDRGATATSTTTVTAVAPNLAPKAVAAAKPTNLAVAFSGTGSSDADGTIASYAWTYGDGTTGTGATPSHTYAKAGSYPVVLTVTDDRGATATASTTATAVAPVAPVVASVPGAVKPDASNTGVPAGTALTVHNGDLTITTPGTVINGMDIRGLVNVKAANVTIKNSVIRGRAVTGNSSLITVSGDAYSLTLQDSEVTAATPSPYINGITGRNFTVVRTNIHHVVDQIAIVGSNVRVESSWLHDNLHYAVDPNHSDGTHDDNVQVQVGSNISFVGNTINGSHNAALMVTQDRGPVSNLTWSKNWADGGACTINIAEKTYGPVQGVKIADSTFGRNTAHASCAVLAKVTSPVVVTNSFYTDGATVVVKKG